MQVEPHSAEDRSGVLSYEADLCGNIEQALKGLQGYGLMALELIQNADDAGATSLSFDVTSHGLIVRNNAEFTSCGLHSQRCPWERNGDSEGRKRPCNFHAISRMGSRSKLQMTNQIGRFGIGFVSVYQITDTPIVRSAGTQVVLDPLAGEVSKSEAAITEGTVLELPWASKQTEIRDALNASPTPIDVVERLLSEVQAVLRSSLLFLRHLERVEVRKAGSIHLAVQINRSAEGITLVFSPEEKEENWLVLSRDADDIVADWDLIGKYEQLRKLNRSTQVSVAFALDDEPTHGLLYAYLPTRQKTGMPLHINGDFFPHGSRQHIVQEGEGHERYWNEALLATAAAIIGERFTLVRDRLGYRRFWQLGTDAFKLQHDDLFGVFWERFCETAKSTASVWTTLEEWHEPLSVQWTPPGILSAEQQEAVVSLGLTLLHPDLRPHLNALGATGVRELRLSTIVTSLEDGDGAGIEDKNRLLRPLWDAIAGLLPHERDRGDRQFAGTIEKLKAATFLIDTKGSAVAPKQVWRTPIGVSPSQVENYVPECPFVHPDVLSRHELIDLIDLYELDNFAEDLADLITSEEDANQIIGSEPAGSRDLYLLMVGFGADPVTTDAGATLAETPFLRTGRGFVSPARGKLPGGFQDPMGYLELVDVSVFPAGAESLLKDIFKVHVLSFRDYIDDYLEASLASGPTRDQYMELLSQIAKKRYELEELGGLDLLADRDFVRTRVGTFVRPNECYYWSAENEAILGTDQDLWVDETWMPRGPLAGKMRDALEGRLGMPTAPSPQHIVNRIEELAEGSTPEEIAKPLTSIMRHLIQRWGAFSEDDFETIEPLKELEYLPAELNGKLDDETLYAPHDVYRVNRSKGFQSQAPVIALTPLRQGSAVLNEVLDFLEMPEEPATGVIVAHLRQCMNEHTPASEVTYAILNERLEKEDAVDAIDALSGTAYIYNGDLDRYLKADQVFWEAPPLGGGYWWGASSRMSQYRTLHSRLGVQDRPKPANYAILAKELALRGELNDNDLRIHGHCLSALCEALHDGGSDAITAVHSLRGAQSLLNVDENSIFPEDAIWIDVGQLAAPFGSDLNEWLVHQPSVERGTAARFFRRLDVPPISEVAHRLLAEEPNRNLDRAATSLLRERKDLLLWLLPARSRRELDDTLSRVSILTSASVTVRTEIPFDPPVLSPPTEVKAFLDNEDDLHVEDASFRRGWTTVFRELFSIVEQQDSLDIAPLVFAANQIMQSASLDDAEAELRDAGFTPPADEPDHITPGETLGDGHNDEAIYESESVGDIASEGMDDLGNGGQNEDISEVDSDSSSTRKEGQQTGDGQSQEEEAETDFNGDFNGAPRQSNAGKNGADAPGAESRESADAHAGSPYSNGSGGRPGGGSGSEQQGATRAGGSTRTSRMTTYVAKSGDRDQDDADTGRGSSDEARLIDIAAIKAALRYEEANGRDAKEQPHTNPGFDIVSTATDGSRRIIEVKGLAEEWTDRGTKLTKTQYTTAGQYRDDYWLYVVENACNTGRQRLSAIKNPFSQVDEYWFDQNWRDAAEEKNSLREINIRKGTRVRHKSFGNGTVIEVRRLGDTTEVTIDFGRVNGKKAIRYNSDLEIID